MAQNTLEMVRKAYEDLSEDDKKKFHQSISDRVHESIAAQERDEGDEDSQSAEETLENISLQQNRIRAGAGGSRRI